MLTEVAYNYQVLSYISVMANVVGYAVYTVAGIRPQEKLPVAGKSPVMSQVPLTATS